MRGPCRSVRCCWSTTSSTSGATEALRKRYGRVAVWTGAGAGAGNAALVAAGGVAINEPEQLLDIPAVHGAASQGDTQLAFSLEPPVPPSARPPGDR